MSYRKLFENLGLYNIENYFNFCQNNFYYGWVDKKGQKHFGVNDAETYILQSPSELIKSRIGICWDLTELSRSFFESMTNLKFETYYLFYDDNRGCPSHSFLVFYDNGRIYYFEPMYNDKSFCYFSGIHEYDNIDLLLESAINVFLRMNVINGNISKNYDLSNIFIYKYEKPMYHINGYEMRNHVNNSKKVEVKYDRRSI